MSAEYERGQEIARAYLAAGVDPEWFRQAAESVYNAPSEPAAVERARGALDVVLDVIAQQSG